MVRGGGRVDPQVESYASLRERMVGERGVIMLIGAPDTGKTDLARLLISDGIQAGRSVAFVDADIASATSGPPACVGLRWVKSHRHLETLSRADELRFVGAIEPHGVVLPHVVAAAELAAVASKEADLVVLDTTGVVGGVVGQTLKYHMMELIHPSLVIAMQRGSEMEPTIGMLKRFLAARVARAEPEKSDGPPGPVEQRQRRINAFKTALEAPLQRWIVQSHVFAPTLPDGFDISRLDGMLVGVQEGEGRCLGLGVLEYSADSLHVATPHGEHMAGLRLGSVRLDLNTYAVSRVRLRELIFGRVVRG